MIFLRTLVKVVLRMSFCVICIKKQLKSILQSKVFKVKKIFSE